MANEPFNGDDYSRIVEFANGKSVKHDIDKSLGLTNVRISNYTYICGKYCMQTMDDNNNIVIWLRISIHIIMTEF